jgi:hypothetical protein
VPMIIAVGMTQVHADIARGSRAYLHPHSGCRVVVSK